MGKPGYLVFAEIPPWYVMYLDRKWPQRDSLKPLGTDEEIRDKITSAFPEINWGYDSGEVHWRGEIDGEKDSGFTIFYLYYNDDKLCHCIEVSLFYQHSDQFHSMCEQHGWREFSEGDGLFTWRDRSSNDILFEMIFSPVRWKREGFFEKLRTWLSTFKNLI